MLMCRESILFVYGVGHETRSWSELLWTVGFQVFSSTRKQLLDVFDGR